LRTCAEALGIAIDMANEKPLRLWRMRKMQGLVRALLADRTRLLTFHDLAAILNAQPRNRWTGMIGDGIGTPARELVEKAALGLCCTNLMGDSSCESSVVAGGHEQTEHLELQDPELARV
jgi:hypothetical protein